MCISELNSAQSPTWPNWFGGFISTCHSNQGYQSVGDKQYLLQLKSEAAAAVRFENNLVFPTFNDFACKSRFLIIFF